MELHSIEIEPLAEERIHFYVPDFNYFFTGIYRDGLFYDAEHRDDAGAAVEVNGISHWCHLSKKPYQEFDA